MAAPRTRSPGVTFLALCVLAFLGFVAGMLGGIVWEEPRLLIAYVMGDTTEIEWIAESPALPEVASGPKLSESAHPALRDVGAASTSERAKPPHAEPEMRLAIQVGAFESSESAERLARELRSRDYAAYVVPGVRKDHPRWRVRVGPFSDRGGAASLATELKRKERLPTWILEEGSGPGR